MANLNRLNGLILGINRQEIKEVNPTSVVKGNDFNKLAQQVNIHNAKIFSIFRELMLILDELNNR